MPKKKGGKKGAKIIDGLNTNEMSREQLMGHVNRIQSQLAREREERNFFMLEREKLYALWNLTLEQLASAKTEARVAELKTDENDKERETEMNVYKQKLRYLMTEQSRKVSQVRLHNLQKMKHIQQDMWSVQETMRSTIDRKNGEISQGHRCLHEMMRQLQTQSAQTLSKLRKDLGQELRQMESTFERLMFEREERQAVLEAEETVRTSMEKSEGILQLNQLHERQLNEMREFFNEIRVNNLAVISTLQEEIMEMRLKEDKLNREMSKGREEYGRLEQTVAKSKEELDERMKRDLKSSKDHLGKELGKLHKRLKDNDRYARTLEVANEALLQKTQVAERERDILKDSFTRGILEMQRKAAMKRLLIEIRLNAMQTRGRGGDAAGINPERTASHPQFAEYSQGTNIEQAGDNLMK